MFRIKKYDQKNGENRLKDSHFLRAAILIRKNHLKDFLTKSNVQNWNEI